MPPIKMVIFGEVFGGLCIHCSDFLLKKCGLCLFDTRFDSVQRRGRTDEPFWIAVVVSTLM